MIHRVLNILGWFVFLLSTTVALADWHPNERPVRSTRTQLESTSYPKQCHLWNHLWRIEPESLATTPVGSDNLKQISFRDLLPPFLQLSDQTEELSKSTNAVQLRELLPGAYVRAIQPDSSGQPQFQLLDRIHLIGSTPLQQPLKSQGEMTSYRPRDDSTHSVRTPMEVVSSMPSHAIQPSGAFPLNHKLHDVFSYPELLAPPGAHDHDHAIATTTTATIHLVPLSETTPASASTKSRPAEGSTTSQPSKADHEYELRDRVGRGHFGELWRAKRVNSAHHKPSSSASSDDDTYVLKRLFVEKGLRTRYSGRREVHFGLKLRSVPGIARLVEWFEEGSALWLVFRDEGTNLVQWMSETDETGQVTPSKNWTRMKLQMGKPTTTHHHHGGHHHHASDSTETQTVIATTASSTADDSTTFGPFLPSPTPSTVSLVTPPPKDTNDSALAVRDEIPELPAGDDLFASNLHRNAAAAAALPNPSTGSSTSLAASAAMEMSLQQRPLTDMEPLNQSNHAHSSPMDSPSRSTSHPNSTAASPHPTLASNFDHDEFKSLFYQLLQAVAELHARGVTHRDIKPANILLSKRTTQPRATSSSSSSPSSSNVPTTTFTIRLCDFGSSIESDPALNELLYPPPDFVPSMDENTLAYAPPEVLFGSSTTAYSPTHPQAYDLWSVGIVMLETLLGSIDHVWSLNNKIRWKIEHKIEIEFEKEVKERHRQSYLEPDSPQWQKRKEIEAEELKDRKAKAVLFRAFVEYCIYRPTRFDSETTTSSATSTTSASTTTSASQRTSDSFASGASFSSNDENCSDERFQTLLQQSDPLGLGAPNPFLIRLIRRLLHWHPALRLSASEALTHAYFMDHAYECPICHQEFELERETDYHIYTSAYIVTRDRADLNECVIVCPRRT